MFFSDPAFVLSDVYDKGSTETSYVREESYFVVNVMEYSSEFYPNFNQSLNDLCNNIAHLSTHYSLNVLLMLTSSEDYDFNEVVCSKLRSKGVKVEFCHTNVETDFNSLFSGAKFALCHRMHSAIFSLSFSIPTLIFSWQSKVDGMLESISSGDLEKLVVPINYDFETVVDKIDFYPAELVNRNVSKVKQCVWNEAKLVANEIGK